MISGYVLEEQQPVNSEKESDPFLKGGPPPFIEEGPITDVERFSLVVLWGHLS
ncbi:hypothetical protein TIFTF001_026222 [Ficus carica]|uniref:Uncharacterized protein n=1 Tax=Ficus carica TaxID=3494 RepID=A0AA88IT43_FICCA|nr:hypothetical protein TIFTF001_026222 [Ficus carica]